MTIYEILEQVAATTKKTEKEAILLTHEDNKTLKEVFRLAYSPTIQFYIKKIPQYIQRGVSYNLVDFVQLFAEKLYLREKTGNEAIEYLQYLLSNVDSHTASVIERIVLKDLRCGVGESTINKVWKGLIVKPPRQGAQSMNEKSLAKIQKAKNLAIELKSDGSYAASVCGESTTMMSRNGNPLDIPSLQEHLSCGAFNGFALEGELIYDPTKATREEGNGYITKIIKGTATEENINNVYYQVWDCVPHADYKPKGECLHNNEVRREILEDMVSEYTEWCSDYCVEPKVLLIPRKDYVSMDEATEIFEQYVKDGFEGAILKDMDATWKDNGKPSWCVKMKRKEPADLECVGVYEGEGKACGSLGGIYLESDCGEIKVKAGSGFSDEQRQYYWDNQNDIVGKIVEVEYDSITKDKKKDYHSLFLPIFKQVRVDKTLADTMQEVKEKQRL